MRRFISLLVAAAALLLLASAPARADFEYVPGQEAVGPDGVCPGIGIVGKAGYQRNAAGVAPRNGEGFYLDVRLTYFESFDCAASFTGIDLVLPTGLEPLPSSSARVVCQRYLLNTNTTDARATANCPATPSLIGGTTYRLDPPTVGFPDKPFAGRNYWFLGYDGTSTYRTMRVLVPVVADRALTSAPVTFSFKRFDAASAWTAAVNVDVSGTPAPPSGGGGPVVPPTLSIGNTSEDIQVSPIGVRFPSASRKGNTTYGVSEKTVPGNRSLSYMETATGVPGCGTNEYPDVYDEDKTGAEVLGDFLDPFLDPDLGDLPCDLAPDTRYTTRFCVLWNGSSSKSCSLATYRTLPVSVDVDVESGNSNARSLRFTPVLRSPRPAGSVALRWTPAGGVDTPLSTTNVARGTAPAALAFSDVLAQTADTYKPHSVRTCFTPSGGSEACGTPFTVVPGRLDVQESPTLAPGQATVTGATFRSPNPEMDAQLRLEPVDAEPAAAADLPVVATTDLGLRTTSTQRTLPDLVASGLVPGQRYAWTVCLKRDDTVAVAVCSPGRGFVAASPTAHAVSAPAAHDVSGNGAGLDATVDGVHLAGRLTFLASSGGGAETEVGAADLPASGTSATRSVSAGGLTAGTTYTWRACFSSAIAQACSAPQTFTTTAAPAGGGTGGGSGGGGSGGGGSTGGGTGGTGGAGGGQTVTPSAGKVTLLSSASVVRKTRQVRLGSVDCPVGTCAAKVVLAVTPAVARKLGRKVRKGARTVTILTATRRLSGARKALTVTLPATLVARLGVRRSFTVTVTLSRPGATAVTKKATAGLKRTG